MPSTSSQEYFHRKPSSSHTFGSSPPLSQKTNRKNQVPNNIDHVKDRLMEKAAFLVVKKSIEDPLESLDEFLIALQHAGRNPTKKFVAKYWTKNTKETSFSDFCRILKDEPENTEEELTRAFRKIDKNRDNFISFDELKLVLLQKGDILTHKEMKDIFSAADLNSDGRIDYNEFVAMVSKTTIETREAAIKRLERFERSQKHKSKSHHHQQHHHHKSHLAAKQQNGPIPEENGFESPPVDYTNRRKASQEENDDGGSILKISAPSFQTKDGPNSRKLNDWYHVKRKGCFFYDDVLVGHRYSLHQSVSQTLWISICPFTNTSSSSKLPVETILFVVDKKSGKIVAYTEDRDEHSCFHTKCYLEPGDYLLLPYTTGCRFRARRENTEGKAKSDLIEHGEGQIKLTKQFRMVLMNIFDLFDLDDSGGLNREEFNLYNIRTGDDHVSDEEWEVVKQNLETKNDELTLKGFIQLHQMEADDGAGDTEDMWISLEAVGYNNNLQMDEVCPFMMEIYAEDSAVTIVPEVIQSVCEGSAWNTVTQYMLDHSKELCKDEFAVIREFSCSFYGMLIFSRVSNRHDQKQRLRIEILRKQNIQLAFSVNEAARNLRNQKLIVLPFVPENEEDEIRIALRISAGSASSTKSVDKEE